MVFSMAVEILGRREIEAMRRAGQVASRVLHRVCARIEEGVSTAQIDAWVRQEIQAAGARSSQLGYHGFPASVCTSVNEVVCHGVPRHDRILRCGDIINVDVTTEYEGFHGDCSRMVLIGRVDPEVERLCRVTKECMELGIATLRSGVRLGDIGSVIQTHAQAAGFRVVSDYGGHGIGRRMHQAPHVMHTGSPGRGLRLRSGMAITIEPILVMGSPRTKVLADDWTVVTKDGSWSAQWEHTVLVGHDGAEVLTRSPDG